MQLSVYILVVLLAVDAAFSTNRTKDFDEEEKTSEEMRNVNKKKTKKDRSTSSSSGGDRTGENGEDSLDIKESWSSSESDSRKKRTKKPSYIPKSSEERRGWRKWHRKCKKCPEDMKKKWRDPTIRWICGGYQRARRTFKSQCMMEYRNCQDGTMFVKISNNRCKNETGKESYFHGDHFFYEYRVITSHESSDSKASTSSEESSESRFSY